jgi:hypothetical protein
MKPDRHTPRKRYVIRYNPTGSYDNGPTWEIYDRQLHAIVEGGYTKQGAIDAAAFHNFKAYGPGPWRP